MARSGDGITLDTVRNVLGAGSNERVLAIVDALAANDVGAGIAAINGATEAGVEPGVLAGQIVATFRALLYAAYAVPGASETADTAITERTGQFAPAEVAYITKLFSQVEFRLKHTAYGHLPLELAVVDAVLMRTGQAVPITQPAQSAPMLSPSPRRLPRHRSRPRAPSGSPSHVRPHPRPPRMRRLSRFARSGCARSVPESPVPSPTAPVASDVPAATVDGLTIERIHEVWSRVKQGVKMEGRYKTYGILSDVDPHDVRGNVIVFRTTGKFYHDHMSEDETRLLLEKVIGGIVGQPVRVICELMSAQPAERPGRNGSRPLRPVTPPAPVAAIEPPPAPEPVSAPSVLASVPTVNAANAAPVETVTPAASGGAEAHVQRIANLFDAEILSEDEAPPFPKQ